MARKAKAEVVMTHTCTRTGVSVTGTKDEIAEVFYRDNSTTSGFSPWTKDAEREYNKAYRAALKASEVARKGDADEKGVVTFDNTMSKAGVRTSRAKRDGTRTKAAKARTTTRRAARRNKATKVA